jgi:hypothetical protein
VRARWATGRTAGWIARFATLVVAGHLSQAADADFGPDGPLLLGLRGLDARPLFVLATVAGVVYAFEWRVEALRWTWLVLLTLCAWGRALSLLVIGSEVLDFRDELSAFVRWGIVWLAGILAALILTAADALQPLRR